MATWKSAAFPVYGQRLQKDKSRDKKCSAGYIYLYTWKCIGVPQQAKCSVYENISKASLNVDDNLLPWLCIPLKVVLVDFDLKVSIFALCLAFTKKGGVGGF